MRIEPNVVTSRPTNSGHFLSCIFTRESSYCFQRGLAIAILSVSVCLSVKRVDQSKTVQARITKSSPSAGWKTLVLGTVKLFHKFEGVTPNEGARGLNDRGWAEFAIFGQYVAVSQ